MRAIAYKNRQDYQNLQNQVVEYKAIHAAYRSQRLPSLSFGGYYGVSQVNGAWLAWKLRRPGHAERAALPRRPSCAAIPKPPRLNSPPSTLN